MNADPLAFSQEVKRFELSSARITNSRKIHIGSVPASDTTQISIDVVNDTEAEEHFEGIILNCNCADAKFEEGPLLPGQTRRLTVALKPQKQLRRGQGTVHVSFKRPGAGVSNLRLTLNYAVSGHFSFDSPFATLQYGSKPGVYQFELPVFVDPALDHRLLELNCNDERVGLSFGDFDQSGVGHIDVDLPPNSGECFAVMSMRHPPTNTQVDCQVLIQPRQHLKVAPSRLLFRTSGDGSLKSTLTVIRSLDDDDKDEPTEKQRSPGKPIVEWSFEGQTGFGKVHDVSDSLCRASVKIPVATAKKLSDLLSEPGGPKAKQPSIRILVRWGEHSVTEDLSYKIFEKSLTDEAGRNE
ncbi:DUF1573 domain-containing protein [Rhodopirellula sp. P2]|uniref:DUF1573 domain-containing protein n=1 Tax=Rhodopirellula sp. P2 TaxID=2127060 RepID=UPI002367C2CD|nr:DUF1573 domain-containing protein [Rhodopirellula sp. P2]WDQ18315.1 DUF1573 domain-containing protein [Rhodopirellula sp. P2]